ncbi:hypothetical protein FOZ63_034006 [Perkinsus olseni]|uniref:Uncharacterized protein n=1 Tax=Perkinsus olseni TaxID=32597 RepID=A0A7J6UJ01_PEROL|nr:hypothetical protein FOZ63_034006 [Perkinsus olseni]
MLTRLSALASLFGVSIAGSPPSPNGIYCGSSDHWSTIVLVVNSTAGTFAASGTANMPDAAPWHRGDIHFHMNPSGSEMVVEDKKRGNIGGFGYPPPTWSELRFDSGAQAIIAPYRETTMVCTHDQCPGSSGADKKQSGADGLYCCSSRYWSWVQFRVDASHKMIDISGVARKNGAAPWHIPHAPFCMAKHDSIIVLGVNGESRRSLRKNIGGFGYNPPAWKTLAYDVCTNTITVTGHRGEKIPLNPKLCPVIGPQ